MVFGLLLSPFLFVGVFVECQCCLWVVLVCAWLVVVAGGVPPVCGCVVVFGCRFSHVFFVGVSVVSLFLLLFLCG